MRTGKAQPQGNILVQPFREGNRIGRRDLPNNVAK
jgi:hypothetical protein